MAAEHPNNPQPEQPVGAPEVANAPYAEVEDLGEPTLLADLQERAIAALINQPTILKAAQSIGVGERTLHRWMRQPEFVREYRRTRRETFAQAIGVAQRFAPLAVATLGQIMSDPKAGNAARVSAASMILKFSRESLELDDLAERIEALEETTAQAKALIEANQQSAPAAKAWAA